MLFFQQHRIFREDLRANQDVLYIFGDNLDRKGLGGQAAEMRGEPNAFGIATKRAISHGNDSDYFFDSDADARQIIEVEFERLVYHLHGSHYRGVCLPLDGIGTGLAMLPDYAPLLLKFINEKLEELQKVYETR